jgi:hypothetical protein
MSGIFILIALGVGIVLLAGVWAYGRWTRQGPGKVRPDAQPTPEEKRRPEPPAGSS